MALLFFKNSITQDPIGLFLLLPYKLFLGFLIHSDINDDKDNDVQIPIWYPELPSETSDFIFN